MAKLTGKSGIGGRRDQALGPAYRISMWRGIPRVYAKQIAKKKKISPRQKAAMDNFRGLANVAKYISPAEYETALAMSKGSQYLWRDLIYMTYSGRLFYFAGPDGKKVFSMAGRTTTSDILDAISQTPGTILFRGPSWWDELPPGLPGQVLEVTDAGLPSWQDKGGGGGGSLACTVARTSDTSSSFTWPKFPDFQTADLDDFGGWDAAEPDRITFPAAATRFRVSANIQLTASSGNFGLFICLYDPIAAADAPNRWAVASTKQATAYNNNTVDLSTGWLPRGSLDAIGLRVNNSGGASMAILAQSAMTVEVDQM